jgi:GTP-binding protein Era
MRTLAAELIREKILQQTYEEVPHSVAVEIEEFIETKKLTKIGAVVLVEKESQKGILIGKHGERLKLVGTAAREDMERLFGDEGLFEGLGQSARILAEDEQTLAELGY